MPNRIMHFYDVAINKGIMLSYAAIIGGVLSFDVEFKTLASVVGVLIVNLIALLKWGVKIEKAVARNEERTTSLIEKIDFLSELVISK